MNVCIIGKGMGCYCRFIVIWSLIMFYFGLALTTLFVLSNFILNGLLYFNMCIYSYNQ